ncbi:MAG TPA: DUF4335 domain-containing protein [Coleofasciculaceae cyanobacterium]
MTIRRQYSLPNCTLILEGLSDGSGAVGGQLDARPLMTMLVNAECNFAGQERSLSGGRDFFESLVRSVSRYAQEFLSQVHHPKLHGDQPELVHLQKVKDRNLHRLTLLPTADAVHASSSAGMYDSASHAVMTQGIPVQLDLTTVQLFDLVEAIDQFLADRRTLPDIGVSLQPVSKRYRKADQPAAKRAAPAIVGMTSLAVAAIAFSLVPVPQVSESKSAAPQPNASKTTSQPTPGATPQAAATPRSTPPSASVLEKVLTETPEITDPTELRFLQRRLYNKVDPAWKNRGELAENLEYRVGVGKDGAIVGYKPVNAAAGGDATQKTPLPDLLYIPTNGSAAASEPIAQYRVVFSNRGILQISPWRGYTAKPSLGPEITDSAVIRDLNDKLYTQIRENWKGTPTFPRQLVYRVGVTKDGVIADYEPTNQPASDYVQQTPLNSLLKPEAAGSSSEKAGLPQEPLAHFQVVFKPGAVLEVSPFQGYR